MAAADTCTTPPPAFSVALLNGRPWSELIDSLNAAGVQFPDIAGNDSILAVRLCKGPGCTPVKMAIRSSNFTPCLKAEDLTGSRPRILGEYVLQEPFNPPTGSGWNPIPKDSSVFVFAHASGAPATMVYAHNGQTTMGPAAALAVLVLPGRRQRRTQAPPGAVEAARHPAPRQHVTGQSPEAWRRAGGRGRGHRLLRVDGVRQRLLPVLYAPAQRDPLASGRGQRGATEVTLRVPRPYWCQQR